MAGGGIKPGIVYGETDDFSYNIVKNPVHIHDLNATILHCLGIDHRRLTYKFQGLDMRLTGVEEHDPVKAILLTSANPTDCVRGLVAPRRSVSAKLPKSGISRDPWDHVHHLSNSH